MPDTLSYFYSQKEKLVTAPDNFTEPCCTKVINHSLLYISEHETARAAFVGKPKKHYEKQPCIEYFYPQILILDTPLALGTPAFLPPCIKSLVESIDKVFRVRIDGDVGILGLWNHV